MSPDSVTFGAKPLRMALVLLGRVAAHHNNIITVSLHPASPCGGGCVYPHGAIACTGR